MGFSEIKQILERLEKIDRIGSQQQQRPERVEAKGPKPKEPVLKVEQDQVNKKFITVSDSLYMCITLGHATLHDALTVCVFS